MNTTDLCCDKGASRDDMNKCVAVARFPSEAR